MKRLEAFIYVINALVNIKNRDLRNKVTVILEQAVFSSPHLPSTRTNFNALGDRTSLYNGVSETSAAGKRSEREGC